MERAMPRLRRVDCSGTGITRRRRGRGFEYFDADGGKITDRETLERIRALVIPPAWRDVWICTHPRGHLQAVGTDAAGRRQYRYHDAWRARRDAEKFDRMLAFARALPELRDRCRAHLEDGSEPARERVLAGAVRLLDLGFFRIGGTPRSPDVESVGLTTMRLEHVTVNGDAVIFDYPAKGGVERVQAVVDPTVRDLVARLRRRRGGGPELLAYKERGRWHDLDARDVNAFIKEHAGDDFSAKDFRTWSATVLAAVAVAVAGWADSQTGRKRAVSHACREVAHYLGNTPAVARTSYIDPRVFDRYTSGWTVAGVLEELGGRLDEPAVQGPIEEAVLDLLTETLSDTVIKGPLLAR
jgi:DNA topoisomerase I